MKITLFHKRLILFLIMVVLVFYTDKWAAKDDNINHRNSDLAGAEWIGTKKVQPLTDSLRYADSPAPIFRKEFIAGKNIRSAKLTITAAGYYRASINGERIGKNYLDPAWTDYSKRIYYSEYDITEDIIQGANCLGITLGNGFYNPLPLRMWGHLNLRDHLPTGQPVFIAILKIEYDTGETEKIVSDNSWKYTDGPIRKNNVYLGEVYDAAYEIEGWPEPGFDDSSWNKAAFNEAPGGKLHKSFFPAIQVTDRITPQSIIPSGERRYMVDMGVNFTGIFRIRMKGEEGDTVSFRFGERIYDNGELNPMTTVAGQIKEAGRGGPGSPPVAWQEDKYIFGDDNDAWYSPEFTFHTYRYMEITGLNSPPGLTDIEGIALNTNVEKTGAFSSSSDLVNSIQTAVERTFTANLQSVQSDCPAREKFGYGGDLNAVSESYIYNYDMQDFYLKTIYDWVDSMHDTCFIDTAPYVGIKYCGISWESAFLVTQYNLYLYYNDTSLVKELYDLNLQWMNKAARLHPNGLVEEGLSDHESLEPVPVELTGTCHYLQCARIMEKFAAIMGDTNNEEKFSTLANKLHAIILDRFWNNPVPEPINRQTLYGALLWHDIVPDGEKDAAADSLLNALKSAPAGHFTTGIFGTKYILEALSQNGHAEEVFKIVNSTEYPGWGHMIDMGATTIWETWKESDNVYSNCHPMFGSVTEWFYKWLGGIRPNPDYPGFERFIINPSLPDGLTGVSCSYKSPYGEIVSNWTNHGNDHQVYEIHVPDGSIAEVWLKVKEQQKITMHKSTGRSKFQPKIEKNFASFDLAVGKYTIVVRKKE